MVQHMGQALDSGRINQEVETFTANDMARAMRQGTGAKINYRKVGALLDRMGIPANRRDYRRSMMILLETLPTWIEAANTNRVSRIRMPPPIV
jgi:hypothetical protein